MNYDMDEAVIDLALGNRPACSIAGKVTPCGAVVFGSPKAGRLARLASMEDIRRVEPSVFNMQLAFKPGDHVDTFDNNANSVGYAAFDIPDGQSYTTIAARFLDCLNLVVE